jgi:2,4-dienoyl-CoA reductase-like NADH-dependent reductase (Old Yellow Enzyme family)
MSTRDDVVQMKHLRSADALRERLFALGLSIPVDDEVDRRGALAQSLTVEGHQVGNRFAILPMEGWDGTLDGRPTELGERRWRRFGASGAKLVWGGEAVAVRHDGRANPHQLVMSHETVDELAALRRHLVDEHARRFDTTDDLMVGLQLTHSGRFARPDGEPRPVIAYRHPLLDSRVSATDADLVTDDELDELVTTFVDAARLARHAGFDFVDVKQCHGYLLHELLSAHDRPGRYGGDFEGRTRFVRTVVEQIAHDVADLAVGTRVSVFDLTPFANVDGVGVPMSTGSYRLAFGGDGTANGIDLQEPKRLLAALAELGVRLVCTTAGSPYYNPHIQRPAFFPPSDGYAPPEDPLMGVARQITATEELKRAHPDLVVVGSGYSYLQDWLAHVAQPLVRRNAVDLVGLGRMALSYPELPADVLAGQPIDRRRICRTFSDCTTAPRNGLVSGCYPLDPAYKTHPDREQLVLAKRRARNAGVSAKSGGR